MPKKRLAKAMTETLVFILALTYAPPMACAFFPQTQRVPVAQLEPEFQSLQENGRPLEWAVYNKGL